MRPLSPDRYQVRFAFARLLSLIYAVPVAALAASASTVLYAETGSPAGIALDSLIVTATRTRQSAGDTLAQVAVITRDDIEAAGTATLAELLQRKAGVEIRSTGGPGQPAGVFIRGASSSQILLLVDGLRVGSVTAGSPAFENIPLELIERIEVVKGPLSGLYGSDAIGGVVQIFTRSDGRARLSADVGAGSYSNRIANAGFTAVEGRTAFTLNAGYQEVAAPRSASNPDAGPFTYNPDRDPYRNSNVLAKLSHTLSSGANFAASAWQSVGHTKFDSGPADDPSNKQILSGIQISADNQFTTFWKSSLRVGQTSDDIRFASAFPDTFKSTQNQGIWFNELKTGFGDLNAGAELRKEKVSSANTDYDARTRDTRAMFAGYLGRLGANQLDFTLRRDQEDQFGRRNTGSIAYGYALTSALKVYAHAGRAFRAPSFNDLYYPGFSNPLLKPERSKQAEAGLKLGEPGYNMSLVYFDNRIDDLIVFDLATFLPQNIARARIKGWEFGGDTVIGGVVLKAALTVQQPEDADTGKQLRSRARQFGSVGASRSFGAWTLSGDITASGKRFDSGDEDSGSRMAGYVLLNAAVHYRLDKTWSLELGGQNLGNRDYELARGYNTPQRTVFLRIRAIAF